jgi:hypothetical protein
MPAALRGYVTAIMATQGSGHGTQKRAQPGRRRATLLNRTPSDAPASGTRRSADQKPRSTTGRFEEPQNRQEKIRTKLRPCLDRVAAERSAPFDLATPPATDSLSYIIGHLPIAILPAINQAPNNGSTQTAPLRQTFDIAGAKLYVEAKTD